MIHTSPLNSKQRERCKECGRAMPRPVPQRRAKARRVSVNRDPAYKRWCTRQNCVACGASPRPYRKIDPAHTERNGMSSKGADSSCVPLCRLCHEHYDLRRAAFLQQWPLDMAVVSKQHYERFLQEQQNGNH